MDEGKDELNFSEFGNYNLRRQYRKLEEIGKQVRDGEMPLWEYTLLHRDALLSPEQQTALIGWAAALQDSLKAHYPIDSLVRKR